MTQIRTPDQRLRIFVSSTMNELADERAATKRAIERLHLTPVMFELGARPYPPRDLYLAYLRQSDVFIGIYGQQYGSVAPGSTVSALEDEFLAATDKPRLIYIRSPAGERDPRLTEMLHRMQTSGLSYHTFTHPRDLARLVSDDLAILVSDRFAAARELPSPEPQPANLPIGANEPGSANRFIDRQQELATLAALLSDEHTRLVTLVGPGGIGKTRLALQSVASATARYDAVAVAELDQVSRAQPLMEAIASALDISETTGARSTDSIARYIGNRRVLLMLDGFEHHIDSAPLVADLIARPPRLSVMVTSRASLHLTGERVFEVPPLAVPSWSAGVDAARRSDSVQLFADRSAASGAALRLDDAQVRTIVEICRRLDGLPLAIELAASRMRMLDLDELQRRLDTSLSLLTGGARDLPPRQQAMRSTIAWSYDLLDETEQRLFARLGVFAGSFALDAAESICGDDPGLDVFDGLASLVDKALLRPDHSMQGQPRFAMLRIIREYANDRLDAAGEQDRLGGRHAGFYRELVIDRANRLHAGDMRPAIDQYSADRRNIQSAVEWYIDKRDGDAAAQMGMATSAFWFAQGQYTEGEEAMTRILRPDMRMTEASRTDATLGLGMMVFQSGDYPRASSMLQPVLDQYVQRGDDWGAATASVLIGVVATMRGSDEGETMLRRAVDAMRRVDDRWGLGFALLALGTQLVIARRETDATEPLEEVARIARAGQEDIMLSNTLIVLGWARTRQQDFRAAQEALLEAVRLAAGMNNQETVARALGASAAMVERRGDARNGALLLGAADGLRHSVGAAVWAVDRQGHTDTTQRLHARLDDDEYQQLTRRGATLALHDLLDNAFSQEVTTKSGGA
jgi:predicted ATPase